VSLGLELVLGLGLYTVSFTLSHFRILCLHILRTSYATNFRLIFKLNNFSFNQWRSQEGVTVSGAHNPSRELSRLWDKILMDGDQIGTNVMADVIKSLFITARL